MGEGSARSLPWQACPTLPYATARTPTYPPGFPLAPGHALFLLFECTVLACGLFFLKLGLSTSDIKAVSRKHSALLL